ncbi:MAG: cupin domain-containing protein [Bdellovibrionales bacterium]|nr:cupin domain-containing protein [Massilia sp.]
MPYTAIAASLLIIGLGAVPFTSAQLKRTPVLTADVAAPGREAVIVGGEIEPGNSAPRHTHPGDEISYVMEGEVELLIDGEAPRVIKAGEGFVVPAGKVHGARNPGTAPLRFVGVYVVDKGKPLATPAK